MFKRSRFYDPAIEGDTGGGEPTAQPAGTSEGASKVEDAYEVTINGETKKVSLDDLKTRYQKEAAADEKFRLAAEKEKKLEAAIKLEQDFEAVKQNDEGAFRRVASRFGWKEEQIEQALANRRRAQTLAALGVNPNTPQASDDDDGDEGAPAGKLDMNQLAAQVAEKLAPVLSQQVKVGVNQLDPTLRRTLMGVVNQNVGAYLQVGIDNDPFLGTFKSDGTPDQVQAIHRIVQEEAHRRASAGKDLTNPAEVQSAIQAASAHLQSLGIQPARKTAPMGGLGSGGTSGSTLHQSERPLERPEDGLNSPDADAYITDLLTRNMWDAS